MDSKAPESGLLKDGHQPSRLEMSQNTLGSGLEQISGKVYGTSKRTETRDIETASKSEKKNSRKSTRHKSSSQFEKSSDPSSSNQPMTFTLPMRPRRFDDKMFPYDSANSFRDNNPSFQDDNSSWSYNSFRDDRSFQHNNAFQLNATAPSFMPSGLPPPRSSGSGIRSSHQMISAYQYPRLL